MSNTPQGLGVYDLATRKFVARFDVAAPSVQWLPDSRHLAYFAFGGDRLMVLDTATGQTRRVDVTLPLREVGNAFTLSPDGRTIFCAGRREEADIWIVERR